MLNQVTQPCSTASTLLRTLLKKHVPVIFVFLLSSFLSPLLAQNNVTIRGRITNEAGQGVAGASVTVKGGNTGTSTNENGSFEITAPSNGTLVISSINYTPKEVPVNGQQSLNVRMTASGNDMETVVVVGYGSQRKRDVTGSVTSVSAATLQEVPAPNVIAQLKGRAAGVQIVSNGSTPGSAGQIRIRGNRTITNSQSNSDALDGPLLVVDGIPYGGSINDINPDDIANLEILKDASATAIYGSRGAGGVILISTKRGRTGKAVISYDGYYGVTNIMGNSRFLTGRNMRSLRPMLLRIIGLAGRAALVLQLIH
jgi:TonB-dependent starch-binding outer membrane protein SusC